MNDQLKRKLRGPGKADTSLNILTRDELERLYVWLQEDKNWDVWSLFRLAVIFTLTTTGLRLGEFLQLTFGCIQQRENERLIAIFIGKGNRKAEIDIHPATLRFCTSLYKTLYRRKPQPEDKLFPPIPLRTNKKRKEGKVLEPADVQEELHKLERELNEGNVLGRQIELRPHLLRHYVGTQLAKSGMPIHRISKVLRHRDVSTTQVYVHDNPIADDVWKRVDALHWKPRKLAKDDE